MAHILDFYPAEWERVKRTNPKPSAALDRMRHAAFDHFLAHGFPTTRDEEWRFTSVAPIAERRFAVVSEPRRTASELDLSALRLRDEPAVELVFVDGR